MKPEARKDGLVVQELPDETLVYDLDRHKAHCLNGTAAQVWSLSDGTRTVEEIARRAAAGLPPRDGQDVVWLALAQLDKARLLRERLPRTNGAAQPSRREIIKRLGVAASLPIVASILAPTAAEAAACSCAAGTGCRPAGCPCATTSDCANPGRCCNGICCPGGAACNPLTGACP